MLGLGLLLPNSSFCSDSDRDWFDGSTEVEVWIYLVGPGTSHINWLSLLLGSIRGRENYYV